MEVLASSPTVEEMLGPSEKISSQKKRFWKCVDSHGRLQYHKVSPIVTGEKKIAIKKGFLSIVIWTFDHVSILDLG